MAGGATASLNLRREITLDLTTTGAPPTTAARDRALAGIVTLTTHCALGGAIRWREQGYLRRDWLLFVPAAPDASVPPDAVEAAQGLKCDLVVAELRNTVAVPLMQLGMRLWGQWAWRGAVQLWRDDTRGRCCLVPVHNTDHHLWLETGRIVAHEGLPWRSPEDRDLGYTRAAAAYRRLVREG